MPRSCAYCGSEANRLTREHIWPKCIIERCRYGARYSERAQKVFAGDLIVSDVCEKCNNGVLSELDANGCRYYDRYFHSFAEADTLVEFEYDYCSLTRWLLKLSYNSARATARPNKRDADILAQFAPVILGADDRPPDVAVWLDLVSPAYYSSVQGGGGVDRFPPASTRLCSIDVPEVTLDRYILRLIAINAFYFYLAVPTRPHSRPVEDELARIVAFFRLMVLLNPFASRAAVKPTGLTTHEVIGPHADSKRELYEQFFKLRDRQ
jgi:hypothetical protein